MRCLTTIFLIFLSICSLKSEKINNFTKNKNEFFENEQFFDILHPKTETDDLFGEGLALNPINALFDKNTDITKITVIFSPSMFESFTYKLNKMYEIAHNPEFKADRPTAIYIHGWQQDGETEISAMAIRSAYRDRGDENIVTVDWSAYSKIKLFEVAYKSSIEHLKVICTELAEQLEKIRKNGFKGYESIYLVGHSLGGQCAGLVGRTLKKISNGEFELARIYALDPARPGFEANELPTSLFKISFSFVQLGRKDFECLSKNDAKYVQIIHTNANELGMTQAEGHSDFYPNDGVDQIGCEGLVSKMLCSHQRSWIYYQESVRYAEAFIGVKCKNYNEFKNSACDYKVIATMGYSNDTLPVGLYYLKTHANMFHTGMGLDGLKDRALKKFRNDDEPRIQANPN